ncbi:hypothetical protein DFP74_5318 [Nocardiopsis sp. Huas11]|nr:hypothetical protein DFP74_5318 [Nocardiopsis sp. Huas11]
MVSAPIRVQGRGARPHRRVRPCHRLRGPRNRSGHGRDPDDARLRLPHHRAGDGVVESSGAERGRTTCLRQGGIPGGGHGAQRRAVDGPPVRRSGHGRAPGRPPHHLRVRSRARGIRPASGGLRCPPRPSSPQLLPSSFIAASSRGGRVGEDPGPGFPMASDLIQALPWAPANGIARPCFQHGAPGLSGAPHRSGRRTEPRRRTPLRMTSTAHTTTAGAGRPGRRRVLVSEPLQQRARGMNNPSPSEGASSGARFALSAACSAALGLRGPGRVRRRGGRPRRRRGGRSRPGRSGRPLPGRWPGARA